MKGADASTLHIVCRCDERVLRKVRYVFDTLLMALGMPVAHVDRAPLRQPWLLYGEAEAEGALLDRCIVIAYRPDAWRFLDSDAMPPTQPQEPGFDLAASAFYFLSSWSERQAPARTGRRLHASSVYAQQGVPQDIVDRHLALLAGRLQALCARTGLPPSPVARWPDGKRYAVVLSHDVDFVPGGGLDIAVQGAKSVLRHLLRQRDPGDAWRAACGFARAVAQGRDPYGCLPEMLEREAGLDVRASYQVAVARRHPADVNYRVEDDRTRDYLARILDAGFDLCLHGSYRSTEQAGWYAQEVELLTRRLAAPRGSRQHFLSFDYDSLFAAQEASGIEYDMSMGYPDSSGARAGFSHPYFPYCVAEDRPYRVLEISLFLMDVTLRSYLGLKGAAAREHINSTLRELARNGGCASVVWHPIVFGGARDPGFDALYWELVDHVRATGGLATDGRTVNRHWRQRARQYASFA